MAKFLKKTRGFTLIELLVVIAIIGLLSTLAVVALNSARQRSRDVKRVADIRQIQTALELGFTETNQYPTGATYGSAILGSATSSVLCKDASNPPNSIWQGSTSGCGAVYLGIIAPAPTPPSGNQYVYNSPSASQYSITFTLEGDTGMLKAGPNCANPNGIQAGTSC
jgi:prepilin-type N-terminal cleavage/methylation domain-containing protein